MGQGRNEIANAIETLNLGANLIELPDDKTGFEIFQKCLDRFVNSGDRKWWWEDFKNISFSIGDIEMPFKPLEEYIPNMERKVWFIVEDDEDIFYPIYICSPKILVQLIGSCLGFEYYIVDINFNWLICENHHSRLIGTGKIDRI